MEKSLLPRRAILIGIALLFLAVNLVRSADFDTINLFVTPNDIWPPIAITDLTALAGNNEGQVDLSWTAPYEDDGFPTSGAVQGYYIVYDTFSIYDLGGDTTAWWNTARGWKQITFASPPGETEQRIVDSLWPGSTYYFAIKSYDDASPPNESPIDSRAASVTDQAYCVVPDTPPATPKGLTAIAGAEKVDLSWTELSRTEKGMDFDYYMIYRSSVSPSALIAISTTTSISYSDIGLQPDTSYYYAISAVDQPPLVLESPLSEVVTVWVVLGDTTPPAAVTNLFAVPGSGAGEVDLTWTEVGDDGTSGNIIGGRYGVKYSTDPAFAWDGPAGFNVEWPANTIPGRTQNATIGSLIPGVTYYFRIWTRDEAFNWSSGLSNGATAWAQIVTLAPEPPTGLVAKAGNERVTLTWTPNSEENMSRYWVFRSTASGSYNYSVALATVTHPTTEYVDTGLINGVTYYYELRAVNEAGYVSEPSYEVWARPSLRPREPCGVKGTLVNGGKQIKIQWKAVTRNEDGSACTDLQGYSLYRASSLGGFSEAPRATVAQSVLTWNETEDITNKTYYYKVRAVDTGGVESADSMVIMVQDGKVNVIALAEDMQAKLIIPEELTDILYEESNSYSDDLNIKIEEVEEEESKDKVISCYEYKAWKGYGKDSLEEIKRFSFNKPKVSVSLSYEVNSQGLVKGTSIKASQAGKELGLFWFNGIEWVKLGARTDTVEQVLTIRTKKLGKYKIEESPTATEFTLNDVYPRIFTPNGDGLNDVVKFSYANPNNKGVVCRIFDVRGALVRQLDIGDTETSFEWDGKDEKGRIAPSGVYIYQLEAGGKVINGTVILAK
jgi:gliding motility-associated-like protein